MKDFSQVLQPRFPNDGALKLYAAPHIPAAKLGSAMSKYHAIAVPKDVIGVVEYGSLFSGGLHAFTGKMCYHPGGKFALEDMRSVSSHQDRVEVTLNQGGLTSTVFLKVENPNAARLLVNALDAVVFAPKTEDIVPERDYAAEGFSPEAINWLELRDEVMKTVDMLYQRFQDGKISLTEWETKRFELLERL
jgi:hypothetical protein